MMIVTWSKVAAMNKVMVVLFWADNKGRISIIYNWIQCRDAKKEKSQRVWAE